MDDQPHNWNPHDIFPVQCYKGSGDDTVYMIVVDDDRRAHKRAAFHVINLDVGVIGVALTAVELANHLNIIKAEPCTRFDG